MLGNAFRLFLMVFCMAGFFWPIFVQIVGGLVLFTLIFGKPREMKNDRHQ